MKVLEVIIVTLILAKQTIKPIIQIMVNILIIIIIGTNKKEVMKMLERIKELQNKIFYIEMAYDRIYGQPIEKHYNELCQELRQLQAQQQRGN